MHQQTTPHWPKLGNMFTLNQSPASGMSSSWLALTPASQPMCGYNGQWLPWANSPRSPQGSLRPSNGHSSPEQPIYIYPGYHTDIIILYVLYDMKKMWGTTGLEINQDTPLLHGGWYWSPNQIRPLRMEKGKKMALESKLRKWTGTKEPIRGQTLPTSHYTTVLSVPPSCCFDGSDFHTFPSLAQHSECRMCRYPLAGWGPAPAP